MSSIRKVAQKAGVSIATVSRVMNCDSSVTSGLRNKVVAAIDSCNYHPSLRRRSCNAVALLYAGQLRAGSPFDSSCIAGMIDAMRRCDLDLCVVDLVSAKLPGESFLQFFARKGICGAIVRSTAAEHMVLKNMSHEQLPLVVLGDHFDQLPSVYASSRSAGREAMEHLISLGHQNIAFAASDCEDGDHGDRYHVYCDTMRTAGLLKEEFICRFPPHAMGGAQLLRKMMAMPNPPTAVFVADSFIASRIVNEAHYLGLKIPSELSIVGFDDTNMRSVVRPRMTAVCQDSFLLGSVAFEWVVQIAQGVQPHVNANFVQNAWLEINSTTAPPAIERFRLFDSGLRIPTLDSTR